MATVTRACWPHMLGLMSAFALCAGLLGACSGELPPNMPTTATELPPETGGAAPGDEPANVPAAEEAGEPSGDAANTSAAAPYPEEVRDEIDVPAPEETAPPPAASADAPVYAVTPGEMKQAEKSEAEEEEEEEEDRAAITLTPAMLAEITVGMPVDAVRELVGSSGHVLTQADVDSSIMRWTDEDGNVFVAKFEDGHLQRKYILTPDGSAHGEEDAGRTIERADYEGIAPGMTVEQVTDALGVPPRQVTSDRAEVIIYSWRDAAGSSFIARFEDGKLIQKSGFFVAPLEEEEEERAEESAEAEGEGEGEGEPAQENAPVRRDDRRLIRETPAQQPVAQQPQAPPQPQVTSVAPPSRVRVVGGRREEPEDVPENQRGSYQPRAKLPEFTWGLRRGAYEMRIENPTDTRVQAGLRAGEYGKDITIPPNSTRTVGVDRANYQLFYIFDDAPYTLHSGASIDLRSDYMADVRITLFNQAYDVEAIDYAAEFWRNTSERERREPR